MEEEEEEEEYGEDNGDDDFEDIIKTQIRFASLAQVTAYITQLDENYCCDSYEFGPDVPMLSCNMQIFFDTFGPDVKCLKLHQTEWTGPELWDILSRKLPSLEELSVRIFIPREANFLPIGSTRVLGTIRILKLNFSIEKPYKASPPPPEEVVCPTILKELLLAMPSLEEIYCPSWPTYVRPDKVVSGLFYNVIFAYPEIKFAKLSYIHINAALDNAQLFALMDKNFPLKELRLELHPDVQPYAFYFLLKSLEATLKTLILIFHPDYDAENFDQFPTLRNLEYLSLHKYCGPVDGVVKYLPRLKTLLLNDSYVTDESCEDGGGGDEEARFRANRLEELVIEGVTYCPHAQLNVLTRKFQNLKRLRVQHVDDEMLRLVFARLGGLEELVADGKFTDAGVCGIPIDIYLQRLSLNSWAISYLSVLLGINDCKKLKFKRLVSPQIMASSR
ncbi:hypothetical protein Fcan01_14240 [Folsomia candida]|uniref:FBD domain-containing protein n=1 Tax=Folsomia candida TaxID=158441 RepID=A0A226E1N2_FOLCA|nr:hypothetical protein Fcan01_14240 [Folsomia candida]